MSSTLPVTENTALPAWCRGVIIKRPEVVPLLDILVRKGMARGCVTAEDGHVFPVSHPNVRGCAMKLLRNCGFERAQIAYGTTRKSHGHVLFQWVLTDSRLAQEFLNSVRGVVLKLTAPAQMEMPI